MVKNDLNISLATKNAKKLQDAKKIRPLCIFLPKTTAYRKDFDDTKSMSFLIRNDELLENYNEIWEKVKDSLKKELDSEGVYNKKYLKAKIRSYNGKINTNFRNSKIPKKILNVSMYQCNFKNVNMLLKKKKIPKYIINDDFFWFW